MARFEFRFEGRLRQARSLTGPVDDSTMSEAAATTAKFLPHSLCTREARQVASLGNSGITSPNSCHCHPLAHDRDRLTPRASCPEAHDHSQGGTSRGTPHHLRLSRLTQPLSQPAQTHQHEFGIKSTIYTEDLSRDTGHAHATHTQRAAMQVMRFFAVVAVYMVTHW
jgi:hypothetical protein